MGTAPRPSYAVTVAIIVAVVLLIRLPFLNQAIQGDDVYYLAGAEHAQIDPLHPKDVRYVFLGDPVDLRGFPHPPFNDWFLGLLLAIAGDVREVPFHAAYILFSLIAALAMWSLARRFSPHPLWATLLFLAVPAFVINGNSFESDLPFLAFRSLHCLEDPAGFRRWLLTIAQRAAIDAGRRASRLKRVPPLVSETPLAAIPGKCPSRRHFRQSI